MSERNIYRANNHGFCLGGCLLLLTVGALMQQMAIGGDIQSYALSDADFASRYPVLQDAYNQWQANLGGQVGQVGAGATGQAGLMQGLASQIAGRRVLLRKGRDILESNPGSQTTPFDDENQTPSLSATAATGTASV